MNNMTPCPKATEKIPQNAECNLHKITMVSQAICSAQRWKMVGTLQYANPKNSGKSVFLNYLLRHQCREQSNVCKKLKTVFLDVFSGCHCHSTVQCHAAMAPHKVGRYTCNGTQQCHHVHCTLQWHPGATSNPPLLEVRTPMAIAIWGKMPVLSDKESAWLSSVHSRDTFSEAWSKHNRCRIG